MELSDYIEKGIRKTQTVKELAKVLGLSAQQITNAKAHRCGLPTDACAKLAQMLGAREIDVIAASELVTEKKEEKREFWRSFLKSIEKAQTVGILILLAISTNFVTPTPAEAAPVLNMQNETFCIMLNYEDG